MTFLQANYRGTLLTFKVGLGRRRSLCKAIHFPKKAMLDPKLARQFALYGAIGAEVAGSVILGIWGGTYLDKVFVSAPLWTILGMILGSAAAVWRLWKLTQQLSKDEDESNS